MKIELSLIRTKKDYEKALERIRPLMRKGDELSDDELCELRALGALIKAYEAERFPWPGGNVSPREIVRSVMEEHGLRQCDMTPYFGNKSAVSLFMHGKRGLSLVAVRRISRKFRVPAELLIGPEPVGA